MLALPNTFSRFMVGNERPKASRNIVFHLDHPRFYLRLESDRRPLVIPLVPPSEQPVWGPLVTRAIIAHEHHLVSLGILDMPCGLRPDDEVEFEVDTSGLLPRYMWLRPVSPDGAQYNFRRDGYFIAHTGTPACWILVKLVTQGESTSAEAEIVEKLPLPVGPAIDWEGIRIGACRFLGTYLSAHV